ncbi:hypothetical protein [Dactylosporangium sp. CA-139066]|uniref:hypothetical protein n=1 Tax=Dactylosporangium sp. CA-139066 TaxID=3239930 RepID=UPI003D8F7591
MSDQHLKIDKAGVLEVGAQLHVHADQDIRPTGDRIKQDFVHHPVFGGRSGSPVVQAAAYQYVAQMGAAVDFLDGLAEHVSVMARATQSIVDAYQQADTLSAHDIEAVINAAWPAVQAETAAAAAASQRAADTQDRQDRQAETDQQADLRDIKRGAA